MIRSHDITRCISTPHSKFSSNSNNSLLRYLGRLRIRLLISLNRSTSHSRLLSWRPTSGATLSWTNVLVGISEWRSGNRSTPTNVASSPSHNLSPLWVESINTPVDINVNIMSAVLHSIHSINSVLLLGTLMSKPRELSTTQLLVKDVSV